ncbi:MAG TPA: tetratricopeptide repeat protein [Reyranella sp.]|nr:tetratricopeptide repeat protein [Reyranella sp.]
MRYPRCGFWWVLPVLALLAGAPDSAIAQSGAPPTQPDASARQQRLDALFGRLKAITDEAEGDAVVAEIWQVWMQSGDAALDEAMQRAVLAMGHVPGLALPILDDIVARAPQWAEGWNKRATVLFLLGEYDRSLADIERVLALEPRHFGALAGLGFIRMNQGESRQALKALRRALAVNPFLKERHGLIPALEKETGEEPI